MNDLMKYAAIAPLWSENGTVQNYVELALLTEPNELII